MRKSSRYGLNLVEGSDIVNPLVQDVPNYEIIDEELGKNADAGIPVATELLTGTVHALTRENPNAPMFRFVATANYKAGDTFTVDGVQVTALLTSGEPLATGCYVINSNVICCLVGTVLTLFCSNSLAEVHAVDSDKLGGKFPNYYASADDVVEAINLAQNANQISLSNRDEINNLNEEISKKLESPFEFAKVNVVLEATGKWCYSPYPAGFNYSNTIIVGATLCRGNEKMFFPGTTSTAYTVTGVLADNSGIGAYSKYEPHVGYSVAVIICRIVTGV